jgi:hypothetical protein
MATPRKPPGLVGSENESQIIIGFSPAGHDAMRATLQRAA